MIINYDFRNASIDIDAYNNSKSMVKEAARKVADKLNLPMDWINDDFTKTDSFSVKLRQYSEHYKTFCNIVDGRTIKREYLIAMKLVSLRKYSRDYSDILGILMYHRNSGDEIKYEEVECAIEKIYGSIDVVDMHTLNNLKNEIENQITSNKYYEQVKKETQTRSELIQFEEDNPGVLNEENFKEIIDNELSL